MERGRQVYLSVRHRGKYMTHILAVVNALFKGDRGMNSITSQPLREPDALRPHLARVTCFIHHVALKELYSDVRIQFLFASCAPACSRVLSSAHVTGLSRGSQSICASLPSSYVNGRIQLLPK